MGSVAITVFSSVVISTDWKKMMVGAGPRGGTARKCRIGVTTDNSQSAVTWYVYFACVDDRTNVVLYISRALCTGTLIRDAKAGASGGYMALVKFEDLGEILSLIGGQDAKNIHWYAGMIGAAPGGTAVTVTVNFQETE